MSALRLPGLPVILPAALLLNLTVVTTARSQPPRSGRAVPTIADSSRVDTSRTPQALRPVRVTLTRDAARSPFELPYAVTSAPLSARPAPRRTGIGDLLFGIPGVAVQDRANPSQDPRVAIRGFGARSAFGVRGVRIIRDGVPATLPDGQTPLDWIDLELVDRIDVVRGTASALYGNAAGGVIELRTREPEATPLGIQTRLWDGGGLRRMHAVISTQGVDRDGTWQLPAAQVALTRTAGDGPRRWSGLDATHAMARARATVAGTRVELQGIRYESTRAENPGALTALELARDLRLPDSLNVTKRSRKAATQSQLALTAERTSGEASWRGALFVASRTLDNPLSYAIVAVDRAVAGGSLHGAWTSALGRWPLRFGVGADVQRLVDDRLNFENCADLAPAAPLSVRCPSRQERGAIRLDQQERATNVGGYARGEVQALHGLVLSAAFRGDQVAFDVRDHFLTATNADDSGRRTLRAVSPMLGLVWRHAPTWSSFANLSTAFETPTVTELTNQETGAAGLNGTLDPQRTHTLEIGMQALAAARLRLDAAAFVARVRDELVPFDIPNQPGRRAFRNAGQTTRRGLETGARAVWPHAELGVAYTWSHFRFDRYQVGSLSYAGRTIPGVPAHQGQGFLTVRHRALFATAEWTGASSATADDGGTVRAAGYAAWALRGGADGLRLGTLIAEPVVAVDNLFDRHYAGSLVVNATRGRYFEPGLPRRLTALVRLRYR